MTRLLFHLNSMSEKKKCIHALLLNVKQLCDHVSGGRLRHMPKHIISILHLNKFPLVCDQNNFI